MARFLVPIILLLASAGLFVLVTNPLYQSSKAVQLDVASYDQALTKSKELRALRDELGSKRNAFEETNVTKLKQIVPDNVDNIRLVIDINNIAARHDLTLKDVSLGTISDSSTKPSPLAAGSSGDKVGSVEIGFAVTTSYDIMLAFLQDLEHSLRLIDVEKLSFTASPDDKSTYSFTIRTYWLH